MQSEQTPVPQTEISPLIRSYNGDGKNIVLGITGASGAIYGIRMLRALIINNFNVDLIITEYGHYTIVRETGMELKQATLQEVVPESVMHKVSVRFHNNLDLMSDIFRNTYNAFGMIIAPCAMNYIAGIANGECKNLVEKSADYTLSYSKPLIVVPRETPVNRIQLKNLIEIMDAGGKVIPAMPSFSYNPKDFNDLADYIAGKTLSLLTGENNITH